jgi:hypothetical protein
MQVTLHNSYLRCSTCRSGKHFFRTVLKKHDVARDGKQYCFSYSVPCYTETLEVTDDADYARVAIDGTATSNGGCEAKAVWSHLDSFDLNLLSSFATNMLRRQRRAGVLGAHGLSSFARGS